MFLTAKVLRLIEIGVRATAHVTHVFLVDFITVLFNDSFVILVLVVLFGHFGGKVYNVSGNINGGIHSI
jgi:hypothetical protein